METTSNQLDIASTTMYSLTFRVCVMLP